MLLRHKVLEARVARCTRVVAYDSAAPSPPDRGTDTKAVTGDVIDVSDSSDEAEREEGVVRCVAFKYLTRVCIFLGLCVVCARVHANRNLACPTGQSVCSCWGDHV